MSIANTLHTSQCTVIELSNNSLLEDDDRVFIEVMHKAWHHTSTVKVGNFEWIIMYRCNGTNPAKLLHLAK